jgi:hypothetical protein
MHPEIERQLAEERVRDLRRAGAVTRLVENTPNDGPEPDIVIRQARPADDLTLATLAIADGAERPVGRTIVAEVDGSIVAALPLDGGGPFADPFRRTADLVALLEARAKQLAATCRESHSRLAWMRPAALRRLV